MPNEEGRMLVLEVIGGVVVLVGLAVLLAGRSDPFPDEPVDRADPGLPGDRPLRSSDIPRLRFRVALRGYRMEDVDAALEAARAALQAAEQAAGQREVGSAAPAQAGPADEGHGAGGERHEGLAE